jgi:hemoglobin
MRRLAIAFVSAAVIGGRGYAAGAADAGAGASGPGGAAVEDGPTRTLYSRLGSQSGVAAIAAALIDRAAADPSLGRSFKDTNLKRIKTLLAEQLCDLTAGPCRYSGDSMKEVHAGLHISQAEFYTMVDMLREILEHRHVDLASTNQLLRVLAPMKRDIVEPGGPHAAPAP